MSTLSAHVTTWAQFIELPEDDEQTGLRYELHDGEVVLVPPAKPNHIFLQRRITVWLDNASKGVGGAMAEFPYRPAPDLQYWRADVAYLPDEDWQVLRTDEYVIYSPPLIVEVLSASNSPSKIDRQRRVAFSGGTREFWVVEPRAKTIEVSVLGRSSRVYPLTEVAPYC